jgi:hypothetical protein
VEGRRARSRKGGAVPTSTRGARGAFVALEESLLARRDEIEQAIRARAFAIADPTEVEDPAYSEGLKAAISAAIDYGLRGIGRPERSPPSPPLELLAQARLAAQSGVGLDVVLRRCLAGYTLLGDFLVAAVQQASLPQELRGLLRNQAARFERLISAVSDEHRREEELRASPRPPTSEQRRLELVRGLLEGESLDLSELGYDLGGTHIGAVGKGEAVADLLRELAGQLGCQSLLVCPRGGVVWVWLGRRGRLDPAEMAGLIRSSLPAQAWLALGEPGEGPNGWGLTHRQARAASPLAAKGPQSLVCYHEVALIASISKDELLAASLKSLYLEPLSRGRDGGETAKETLRAYFGAARNVSSTAAALGVSRQTVSTRLLAIEEQLGRRLDLCATEIELAIRLAYP